MNMITIARKWECLALMYHPTNCGLLRCDPVLSHRWRTRFRGTCYLYIQCRSGWDEDVVIIYINILEIVIRVEMGLLLKMQDFSAIIYKCCTLEYLSCSGKVLVAIGSLQIKLLWQKVLYYHNHMNVLVWENEFVLNLICYCRHKICVWEGCRNCFSNVTYCIFRRWVLGIIVLHSFDDYYERVCCSLKYFL
jgi:hypothetical protein